jgi:hypothetical protein
MGGHEASPPIAAGSLELKFRLVLVGAMALMALLGCSKQPSVPDENKVSGLQRP